MGGNWFQTLRQNGWIRMTNRSVEIFELRVPLEKISALSVQQRYTYYLLGHIFNEMNVLQKIVGFAIPKHDDIRPARRNAEIAQAFFLFRLAASKIYEAKDKINGKEIYQALNELVFTDSPHLRDSLRDLNKAIGAASWLSRMRNGMGFHYPKLSDWEAYIMPDKTWTDDIVYTGKEAGNVFYDSSATVAMHWMFDKYRDYEAAESVDLLVHELIALINQMNRFTNTVVGEITAKLIPTGKAQLAGKVLAPEYDTVSLPFWLHLHQASSRNQ
ncbi:MAG: hypothetical protein AB1584_06110 [Pseudomonadota bacterium]